MFTWPLIYSMRLLQCNVQCYSVAKIANSRHRFQCRHTEHTVQCMHTLQTNIAGEIRIKSVVALATKYVEHCMRNCRIFNVVQFSVKFIHKSHKAQRQRSFMCRHIRSDALSFCRQHIDDVDDGANKFILQFIQIFNALFYKFFLFFGEDSRFFPRSDDVFPSQWKKQPFSIGVHSCDVVIWRSLERYAHKCNHENILHHFDKTNICTKRKENRSAHILRFTPYSGAVFECIMYCVLFEHKWMPCTVGAAGSYVPVGWYLRPAVLTKMLESLSLKGCHVP